MRESKNELKGTVRRGGVVGREGMQEKTSSSQRYLESKIPSKKVRETSRSRRDPKGDRLGGCGCRVEWRRNVTHSNNKSQEAEIALDCITIFFFCQNTKHASNSIINVCCVAQISRSMCFVTKHQGKMKNRAHSRIGMTKQDSVISNGVEISFLDPQVAYILS